MRGTLLVGLVLCFGLAAEEPPSSSVGRIESGRIIPHYAVGDGIWSTEFRIFSLSAATVRFSLEFFDSSGNKQPLEISSFGLAQKIEGTVLPFGGLRLEAGSSGPLKIGYAVLSSAEFRGLGIDAVITNGANFRTSVPGMSATQPHIRVPFKNSQGSVSCIAWKSNDTQRLDMAVWDDNHSCPN